MAREFDEKFVQEIYEIEPKYFEHPMARLCIGNGWLPIMWSLTESIKKLLGKEEFQFLQIKEKFGTLRIAAVCGTKVAKKRRLAVFRMINMAEMMSFKVCEYCGRRGSEDTSKHWILTLCEECKAKRE